MRPLEGMRASRAEPGLAEDGARGRRVTLLLASTLTILSGAILAPALPAIAEHFAATPNVGLLTRLVLTMPALLIALAAPFAGILADRLGRRPLLIGAMLIYGFAGMSGMVLESLEAILMSRAVLGAAVAGIMTTVTALAGDYYAGPARDRFMGQQVAAIGFVGLGFLVGGGLLAELDWRLPFAVYGLAFALLPAVLVWILKPRREPRPMAAAPGPGAAPAPSRNRLALALLFAAAILNSLAFYLVPTQLPFYLEALGTGSPSRAGLAIGLLSFASAAMSLGYGRLRGRIGIPGMFGIGFGLMAAGFLVAGAVGSYGAIVAAVAVAGLGMGFVMPNLGTAAMALAWPEARGRVAGGLTASIFLGQFLSPIVSSPWIEAQGFATAFRDAGLLLAAIAVTAALIVFGSRGTAGLPGR
ncbi:MAG TPA: MFS transporter [Paracoccaceae bacterium]|nr:MFS transporter [Paracoccaceae bacterium]